MDKTRKCRIKIIIVLIVSFIIGILGAVLAVLTSIFLDFQGFELLFGLTGFLIGFYVGSVSYIVMKQFSHYTRKQQALYWLTISVITGIIGLWVGILICNALGCQGALFTFGFVGFLVGFGLILLIAFFYYFS